MIVSIIFRSTRRAEHVVTIVTQDPFLLTSSARNAMSTCVLQETETVSSAITIQLETLLSPKYIEMIFGKQSLLIVFIRQYLIEKK